MQQINVKANIRFGIVIEISTSVQRIDHLRKNGGMPKIMVWHSSSQTRSKAEYEVMQRMNSDLMQKTETGIGWDFSI